MKTKLLNLEELKVLLGVSGNPIGQTLSVNKIHPSIRGCRWEALYNRKDDKIVKVWLNDK